MGCCRQNLISKHIKYKRPEWMMKKEKCNYIVIIISLLEKKFYSDYEPKISDTCNNYIIFVLSLRFKLMYRYIT